MALLWHSILYLFFFWISLRFGLNWDWAVKIVKTGLYVYHRDKLLSILQDCSLYNGVTMLRTLCSSAILLCAVLYLLDLLPTFGPSFLLQ